jgi:hypothetical protein
MTGIWLLPTRGRIANLRRFLSAAREMGFSTAGWVLVNAEELEADRFNYEKALALAPPGWSLKPVTAACYGDALRFVWPEVKDMDWIGLVSDDLVPSTGNWDSALQKHVQGWNVVSSNDGWQSQTGNIAQDRLHGAIVWSGPLARAVGWIFPDGLTHIFHDDTWEAMGRETGCWQVRPDIMCKHLHESLEGKVGPGTDPNSDLWKHDQAWFENWVRADKDECVGRIRALMESHGIRQIKPDFTGVKLMIATPCVSGKYVSEYMTSLFVTMRMFQEHGVICQMAEEKWTADVALARSKLFSAFLRSGCTHLLTIDDDMAWEPSAIVRLFAAAKDFVAVAGPKKRLPPIFAANWTNDAGDPIPLQYDPQSGTMECGEIGSAFCLMTRACAVKMAEAYPELEFIGVTGEVEHGVYTPMVINRRWYSEDFAFCKRWRAIGGRVFFIPDVALGHAGNFLYHGSFAEAAQRQMQEQADKERAAA